MSVETFYNEVIEPSKIEDWMERLASQSLVLIPNLF